MKFISILKNNLNYLPIFIILFLAFWLRFVNLGYSDFQGDEIKAFFIPDEGQTVTQFLLDQRKGPLQFVATKFLSIFDSNYENQFLMRFPFALSGFLTVLFFYLTFRLHFGEKVAVFASIFIAFNGLFVGLTRIVQYQGFVMVFAMLALYMWTLAVKFDKWKTWGLYLGSLFWATSIMAHYDGVFIAPFMAFLLWDWFNSFEKSERYLGFTLKNKLLNIFGAGLLGAIILATFYVPFIFSIAEDTMSYWQGRISGTGGKVSSSIITHKLYNPIYITDIFFGLFFLGLFFIKRNWKVLLWFLMPFILMEVLIDIPGTHIFNYLMPAAIIAGFGILLIYNIVLKIIKGHIGIVLNIVGISVFAAFFFLQSHYIFVDNKVEYPWEPEKFFVWEFYPQSPVFHLSIFGFPYYRNWEGISDFIKQYPDSTGFYSTNERDSIARHHIRLKKDTNNAGFYVFIHNPQSFTKYSTQEKSEYWRTTYEPVKVFEREGRVLSEIFYMEPGSLDEIRERGF